MISFVCAFSCMLVDDVPKRNLASNLVALHRFLFDCLRRCFNLIICICVCISLQASGRMTPQKRKSGVAFSKGAQNLVASALMKQFENKLSQQQKAATKADKPAAIDAKPAAAVGATSEEAPVKASSPNATPTKRAKLDKFTLEEKSVDADAVVVEEGDTSGGASQAANARANIMKLMAGVSAESKKSSAVVPAKKAEATKAIVTEKAEAEDVKCGSQASSARANILKLMGDSKTKLPTSKSPTATVTSPKVKSDVKPPVKVLNATPAKDKSKAKSSEKVDTEESSSSESQASSARANILKLMGNSETKLTSPKKSVASAPKKTDDQAVKSSGKTQASSARANILKLMGDSQTKVTSPKATVSASASKSALVESGASGSQAADARANIMKLMAGKSEGGITPAKASSSVTEKSPPSNEDEGGNSQAASARANIMKLMAAAK